MRRRNHVEWRDPTASAAIGNVDNKHKLAQEEPISLSGRRDVEPLSRFDDDSGWRGRRRMLRELNRKLGQTLKTDTQARASLLNEIRNLSVQQFTSRVGATEARQFAGRRRF